MDDTLNEEQDEFAGAVNPFEKKEEEEHDFTDAVNPFTSEISVPEPEFGPLASGYKGLPEQVKAVMPKPKPKPKPEQITVYDRGNTGRKVNKAEFIAQSQESGDFIDSEVSGIVPDVKRILYRSQRNVTETIVGWAEDEGKLKNMSPKEREKYLNVMTEVTFGSRMIPTNWADPDVIGEDGRIKPIETISGAVVNIGALIYGGGKFAQLAKLPSKVATAAPKISAIFSNVVGFEASTQLFSDFNYNIFNMVEDMTEKDSEYFGSSIVNYMAAKEDDTTSEKQLKLLVEGLGFSAAIGVLGKGVTGTRQAVFGKRLEEMTREEIDSAIVKHFKAVKENQIVTGEKTVETSKGLKQIIDQNANGAELIGTAGTGARQRVRDSVYAANTYIQKTKQQLFTSRGYMTPKMYQAALNAKHGQRQLISAAENVANRLTIAINTAEGSPVLLKKIEVLLESDLSSAFKVSADKRVSFFAKQRNIPEDVAEAILDARSQIDALSTKILGTPGFSDEAYDAIQSNLKTYMRRSYKLFEDADYKPTAQVKTTAINHLRDIKVSEKLLGQAEKGVEVSAKARKKLIARAQKDAEFDVSEMLGNTDELRDYVSQVKRVGKFYKKNETLSPEIRALLGEIDNPADNIILTLTKAARISEMQDYYNVVRDLGQSKYIFGKGTDAQRGTRYNVKITGTNSKLDNQYTTQEIADALARREETYKAVEADNPLGSLIRTYIGLKGGAQAMQTTYRLSTHGRNIIGGYQFGTANGRILSHTTVDALAVLRNRIWRKGGQVNKKALDQSYEEYLGLGVINTQINVNQYRDALEIGFRGIKGDDAKSVLGRAKKSKLGDAVLEKPGQIYMATDDFFKIGAYEAELADLRKAWGDTVDDNLLKRDAARIVADTMPNYDKIPKSLKALRALPFGNFVAFPAEITRTSLKIVQQASKEITSTNSVIKTRGLQRLAGFAVTNASWATLATASYNWMGFSDEEVEARRVLNSGPYSDGSSLTYFRLPEGKVGYINTQYLDSYQTTKTPIQTFFHEINEGELKGKELDDILIKAGIESVKEFIKPYTSESIATGPLLSIATAMIDKDGRDHNGKLIFGEKGINGSALLAITGKAVLPGTIPNLAKLYESIKGEADAYGNYPQPKEHVWLEQAGIKPVEENLERSFEYKLKDYKLLDRQVYLDRINLDNTPEKINEDLLLTNSLEFQNQQDLYIAVKAAVVLLKPPKTIAILQRNGFTHDRATAIIAGQFWPTDIGANLIENKMDIINKLTGEDRIQFIDSLKTTQSQAIRIYKRLQFMSLEDGTAYDERTEALGRHLKLLNIDEKDTSIFNKLLQNNKPLTPEEREEAGLIPLAVGGIVSEPVPNAPAEPDERINKLTGLPYNESAGTAYMDTDDPLRVLNMAAGGKVKKSAGGKIAKLIAEPLAKIIKKYSKADVSDEVAEEAADRILRNFKGSDDMPSILDDIDVEDYIKLETKALLEEKHELSIAQIRKQFPDLIKDDGNFGGEAFSKARGYTADERATFEASGSYDDLLGDTSDIRAEIQYTLDDLGLTQKNAGGRVGKNTGGEAEHPSMFRRDGSRKSNKGFLGQVIRDDGGVMTEYSIGVQIDGKEVEIPSLVPTLTADEIEFLRTKPEGVAIPKAIQQKAVDNALPLLKEGKSPFYQDSENKNQEASGGRVKKDLGGLLSKASSFIGDTIRDAIPTNIRQLAYDVTGGTEDLTENNLQEDEKKALIDAVNLAKKEGRTAIEYGDYATHKKGQSQYRDVGGGGGPRAFISKLSNPAYSMKTTLGQASFKEDAEGNTIITDQYNFNDSTGEPSLLRFIGGVKSAGPSLYGQARNVAREFGSQEGEGSEVTINLGNLSSLNIDNKGPV